jgi:hypothetical protein
MPDCPVHNKQDFSIACYAEMPACGTRERDHSQIATRIANAAMPMSRPAMLVLPVFPSTP